MEFEATFSEIHFHHKEGLSIQRFRQQVLTLGKAICDLGNIFRNDTAELLMLDTYEVINESVTNQWPSVRVVEKFGKSQYDEYRQSVLIDCTLSLHGSIKKNLSSTIQMTNMKGKVETLQVWRLMSAHFHSCTFLLKKGEQMSVPFSSKTKDHSDHLFQTLKALHFTSKHKLWRWHWWGGMW